MSGTHDHFGWDLLYKIANSKITQESDVVIALAHWFLVKNAGFRCIGVGDDKTLRPEDVGSELLPDGWNDSDETYALRYRHENNVYILLAAKTEEAIVLNLLDSTSRNVSNLSINPKVVVKQRHGPLITMVPTINTILDRFKRELMDPVFSGNTKEIETQTEPKRDRSRTPPTGSIHQGGPRFLPDRPDPLAIPRSMSEDNSRRDPLRNVGRGDLDPLGGLGGGMIFTPPNMPFGPPGGGFNPGFRPPPGARFDPFSPPDLDRNLGRNPNPNPNVFRPPPDYDDMYM